MERPKRPYSVHRRPSARKNRHIYYVRFRDPETGEYLSAVSSGQTSRAGACNWADERLKEGGVAKDTAAQEADRLELLSWLEKAAAATPFGEVGTSLVRHDGQVVRVRKTLEESQKVRAGRDDNP